MHDDDEDRFLGGPLDYVARWTLYLISALFLVACISAMWITFAHAHDWYTTTKDPVTGLGCCGVEDCAPIRTEDVEKVDGGYLYKPTGETIPMNRVQPSRDLGFHRCEYLYSFDEMELGMSFAQGTTRCFFAPPGNF